jgi:hypothetical protein
MKRFFESIGSFIKENLGYIALLFILVVFLIIIWGVVLSGISTMSKKTSTELETSLYAMSEYAYSEGQKDALEGDIRIEKMNGIWIWKKSPWDSGRAPVHMQLQYYDKADKK